MEKINVRKPSFKSYEFHAKNPYLSGDKIKPDKREHIRFYGKSLRLLHSMNLTDLGLLELIFSRIVKGENIFILRPLEAVHILGLPRKDVLNSFSKLLHRGLIAKHTEDKFYFNIYVFSKGSRVGVINEAIKNTQNAQ